MELKATTRRVWRDLAAGLGGGVVEAGEIEAGRRGTKFGVNADVSLRGNFGSEDGDCDAETWNDL